MLTDIPFCKHFFSIFTPKLFLDFMLNTLNVKVQKAIYSIKAGFCVIIDDKLFFSTQTISKEDLSFIINNELNPSFCYTKHFYNFNIKSKDELLAASNVLTQDYKTFNNTSKAEDSAINLAIFASLLPCVVSIEISKSKYFIDLYDPIALSSNEILTFEDNRFDDLKYECHAKVANEASKDSFLYVFTSKTSGEMHYAITVNLDFENLKNTNQTTIRVHSSCYTGDLMYSLRCDCKYQLHNAIKMLSHTKGGGIVVYLVQEGRGIGLANKIKAYNYQQNCLHNPYILELETFNELTNNKHQYIKNKIDELKALKYNNLDTIESNNVLGLADEYRNFLPAKKILDFFNIKQINLITNNPIKSSVLEKLGIKINKIINVASPSNKYNKNYLFTKYLKMGHRGILKKLFSW